MQKRDEALDILKVILVLQMITAHIVQFFPAGKRIALYSDYVNLTTFSGFMFVFGYVGYKAYFSKDEMRLGSLAKHAIKTLIAFYISGTAITFFVYRDLSKTTFGEILMLKRVPGWSEFLLSYVCIYLLIIAYKIICPYKLLTKSYWLFVLAAISLLLTYIDYHCVTNNLLGSIIGTYNYACFPIIQYMSYYIAGVYLAKENKTFSLFVFILSIIGTCSFIYCYKVNGYLPQRFPPCIYWVVGGWFFVYMYYLFTKYLCDKKQVQLHESILLIGKNTLIFLVMSNVVIFAFRYFIGVWYDENPHSYFKTLAIYFGILMACILSSYIVVLLKSLIRKMERGRNEFRLL